MKHYRSITICFLCLACLVLAACSTGSNVTLVPTIDVNAPAGGDTVPGAAPQDPAAGYPAGVTPGVEQPAEQPADMPAVEETGYPVEPGPQQAPAADNLGLVTARLIEKVPAEENPSQTRLRVEVLSSTDIEGTINRTQELVNQEVDLFVDASMVPAELVPGENFQATVRYIGDEQGGMWLAGRIAEITE